MIDKNIKISVIIPIYNTEKYLTKCLQSVIKQTIKDIEIICVNDCSPDNSYSILNEYKLKDDRIIIINHKNNLGLGESRNSGIKMANGEYISFVDSDDYISPDFLEQLYNTAKKYNADIVSTLNILAVYDDKIKKYNYNKVDEWKINNDLMQGKSQVSIKNIMYDTNEFADFMSWNKLWKKDFILMNNLYFKLKDRGEDTDIFYKSLLHDPIVAFNHYAVYYYVQHKSSIVASRGKDFKFIISAVEFINNNVQYYQKYDKLKLPYLMKEIIWNVIYEIENYDNKQEAYKYVHNNFLNLHLNREDFLYLKEYILFYTIRNFDDYNFFNLLILQNDHINIELNYLKDKIYKLNNLHDNLINYLAWFIPINKWREDFRNKFKT